MKAGFVMYNRKIDYDVCRAQIIRAHQDTEINAMSTVQSLDEFESIYKNKLYDDAFLEISVLKLGKGLRLDRTSALAWLSSDESEFEQRVSARHKIGQSISDISWVYGVDQDTIQEIVDKGDTNSIQIQ